MNRAERRRASRALRKGRLLYPDQPPPWEAVDPDDEHVPFSGEDDEDEEAGESDAP